MSYASHSVRKKIYQAMPAALPELSRAAGTTLEKTRNHVVVMMARGWVRPSGRREGRWVVYERVVDDFSERGFTPSDN